jgi:alginate O-acetyltransferase complex protein AlgI
VAFKVLQMPGSADSPTVGSLSRTSAELFGFSYFLFRALNFVFMQRIAKLDERNPLAVAYYFLFLPTLTSGPIQKYLDFRQQVNAVPAVSWAMTGDGLYRIVRGFFRKIVLAATLDQVVLTQLASAALAPWQSALIVVGLYLFFYFDFAGYSDIAIGFGLLLGIRVPENFRQPFLATTLTEFWRNWHISLVDWLRDHVFIPLGGMRAERKRAGLLALLVMLLCGLWHGITWPFLLWGLWHGGHMMAESLLGVRPIPRASQRGARYFGMVAWTNLRVALGALLFLPSLSDIGRVLGGFVP